MATGRLDRSGFVVLVSGSIDRAEFAQVSSIYCKYSYVFGADWKIVSGVEEGLSSTCERSSDAQFINLNTPLDITFSSTNPFRWPQLIVSCYGRDVFGNDVVRGYGATQLPTVPGTTSRVIPMFIPQASTWTQDLLSFFTGRRAEFIDTRIVAVPQGRESLLHVTFNTVLRDMKKFGYDVTPATISRLSDFPLPQFDERKTKRKSQSEVTREHEEEEPLEATATPANENPEEP